MAGTGDGHKKKRNVGTVIFVLIIVTFVILGIVLHRGGMSENQAGTLKILLIIMGCSIAYCFIVGEVTKNYSQMDKLWSILPIVYAWVIFARGNRNPRLLLNALTVTAWGIRLTVNFARKGAYRLKFWEGNEDYRWSIVRQSPVFKTPFAWTLFDLFFISIYQNALVLAITLPALAYMESVVPIGIMDVIAVLLAVTFLVLETVSDEYQWAFHQKKKKLLSEGKVLEELPAPYDLGFNTTGPWGVMRHPNYLGEQGIWNSLYLFVIGSGAAHFGVFHWTMTGPLLLILLFMGSSALGEKISSGKYPKYKDYMGQVFKYLPIRKYSRKD